MADESLNTRDLLHWVAELQAGRPNWAEPVLGRIVTRVERIARATFKRFPRVGRFVNVDDVIQNGLLRLLAAFRKVRPASTRHFYALTNELIRRELLDLTRHFYGPRGHGTHLAELALEGEHGAAHSDADLELPAAFHEAVERLPVEQREVVGLTYYHGWTQAQIADLFHVSVRTVQRWQNDALAALKERLADDGDED